MIIGLDIEQKFHIVKENYFHCDDLNFRLSNLCENNKCLKEISNNRSFEAQSGYVDQ